MYIRRCYQAPTVRAVVASRTRLRGNRRARVGTGEARGARQARRGVGVSRGAGVGSRGAGERGRRARGAIMSHGADVSHEIAVLVGRVQRRRCLRALTLVFIFCSCIERRERKVSTTIGGTVDSVVVFVIGYLLENTSKYILILVLVFLARYLGIDKGTNTPACSSNLRCRAR